MTTPQRMKVAVFVGSFPGTYVTFIRNQIEALLAASVDIELYTLRLDRSALRERVFVDLLVRGQIHDAGKAATERRRTVVLLDAAAQLAFQRPLVLRVIAGLWWRAGRSVASDALLLAACLMRRPAQSCDVLHAQYGTLGIVVEALKRAGLVNGPLVTAFRGSDLSHYLECNGPRAYDDLISNGAMFLPVSEYFAERLRFLGARVDQVRVVRSGVDLEKFTCRPRRAADGQALQILSVGRLVEKKGHDHCIAAVAALAHAGRNVHLSIIGTGRLNEQLQAQIAELNAQDSVSLLGELPHAQVIARMEEADILLNHSVTPSSGDQEGVPNVIKEAMACGLPVIASAHAGTPELVVNGETGLLVAERDTAGIINAILRLADNPQEAAHMACNAARKVRAEYDRRVVNEVLLNIYRRVMT